MTRDFAHGSRRSAWRRATCSLVVLGALFAPSVAFSQINDGKPEAVRDIKQPSKIGSQIPLDLTFINSDGKPIQLKQIFDGTKPVLLTMNYSDCPMLCSLQLDGLVEALGEMKWTAGDEYELVTISIDPTETPERADLTKQKYLKDYGRAQSVDAWRFLVSPKEADIRQVADAIGFSYKYLPDERTYAHAALLSVCTPEGKVAQQFGQVAYSPVDLRLSLTEARQGKTSGRWDGALLYCFVYDPDKGSYTLQAWRLVQMGGVLTVLCISVMVTVMWRRERRKAARRAAYDLSSTTNQASVG